MLILNNLIMKPENNQPKVVKNISLLNKNEINANLQLLNSIANKIFNNIELKYPKLKTLDNIQKMEIINKIIDSLKNNNQFKQTIENSTNVNSEVEQAMNVTFHKKNENAYLKNTELISYNNAFFSESITQYLETFANLLYGVGITAGVVSGIAAAAAAGYYAAAIFSFGFTIPEAIDCTALATTSGLLSKVAVPLSQSIDEILNNNWIGLSETIGNVLIQAGLESDVRELYTDLIAAQVASIADEIFDPEDIGNIAAIATILTFMVANNLVNL